MKRGLSAVVVSLVAMLIAAASSAEQVRLVSRGTQGSELVVELVGSDLNAVGSMDLTVGFDPAKLGSPQFDQGPLTFGAMVVSNPKQPGRLRIGLIAPAGVSGEGNVATLRFPIRESGAMHLSLTGKLTDPEGSPLPSSLLGMQTHVAAEPVRELAEDGPRDVETPDAGVAEEVRSLGEQAAEAAGGRWGETDVAIAAVSSEEPVRSGGPVALAEVDAEAVAPPSGAEPRGAAATGAAATPSPPPPSEPPSPPEQPVSLSAVGERAPVEALGKQRPGAEWQVDLARPENELEKADLQARLAGYNSVIRFEPRELIAEGPAVQLRARIQLFRHLQPLEIDPADLRLIGSGAEIVQLQRLDDRSLVAELRVDGSALPAYLELRSFGLYQRSAVPVYPRVDVDLDGSGELTGRDLALMRRQLGALEGEARYSERVDIVRDGRIDDDDYSAFRFILIEEERARRLKLLESGNKDQPREAVVQ